MRKTDEAMLIRLRVNGEMREADVWPGSSLLYVLREHLQLPGSKNACEQGECGSCSVWLDGELVCSCLVLGAQAHDREVRTVEGLAGTEDDRLHPVQAAFVEAGAVQCGFCTPGLVVAVTDLLVQDPSPTEPVIREALSGNLCRCTGYAKIIDAVNLAAKRMRGVRGGSGPAEQSGADQAAALPLAREVGPKDRPPSWLNGDSAR